LPRLEPRKDERPDDTGRTDRRNHRRQHARPTPTPPRIDTDHTDCMPGLRAARGPDSRRLPECPGWTAPVPTCRMAFRRLVVAAGGDGTCSVGTGWRESPDLLAALLREHGQDPDRVESVDSAWRAFRDFLSRPLEGLDFGPDSDSDGFIVQWGRYSWHDH